MAACSIVGFDPYIGYLHADKYGRPALALDLVEEWRPAMVDLLVLSLINKRMIKPDDFEVGMGNIYRLSKRGLKKISPGL
jgi:CRISPR-associated protein Cas1